MGARLSSRLYSPIRFFPSCITLRSIRLIRVWYPGPFDLNQSTTSRSTRSDIRCFRGRFHRDSGFASSSASENKSSSTEANKRSIVRGCTLAFFLLFFDLRVMTQLYIPHRHHITFLQEHSSRVPGRMNVSTCIHGSPKAYTALPAAIATYSFPSTENAIGAA